MIEWHRLMDKLPPYEVDVLVCDSLFEYTDVCVACLEKDEDVGIVWFGVDGSVSEALYNDYWAYINLPKFKKGGD